ncbi:cytochrome P450 [Paracoccaceae bacterium]|nr:cytochrome P450 [Paracoccaceae bacterium]
MSLFQGHKAIKVPQNIMAWDIDPYSKEVLLDPETFFSALREKGPFVYLNKYKMLACGRYKETKEVFSDHKRFVSSRGVGIQDFKLEKPWRPPSLVLEVDPPKHTKNRRLLTKALSPNKIAQLKDFFKNCADELINELLQKKELDGILDLAEIFPTRVFPEAVGLKKIDKETLLGYGAMVFNALGPDNDFRKNAMAKGLSVLEKINKQCLEENIDAKGLAKEIYRSTAENLEEDELAGMLVRSLLSAGIDTTVSAIGNLLWCFAKNPEQFQLVKDDKSLVGNAVEESLRLTSPVKAFCRTSAVETEVSGVTIEEGTKILCVLGSANTDPQVWDNPYKYDVTRRTIGHLALGIGVHNCVGQTLARAEITALTRSLTELVKTIRPAGKAVWKPNNAMRSLQSLPIILEK